MQAKVLEYLELNARTDLLIFEDEKHIRSICDAVKYLGYTPIVFPDFRATFGDDLRSFSHEIRTLLSALYTFYNTDSKKIILSPYQTLLHELPDARYFKNHTNISFASSLDIQALKDNLYFWGYSFVDIVEDQGEVAMRGDIIDIFPINFDDPVRISLFDDEVEDIKHFKCTTQRVFGEELESVDIIPALFGLDEDEFNNLHDIVQEIQSDSFERDILSLGFWGLEHKSLISEDFNCVFVQDLSSQIQEDASFGKDFSFLNSIKVMAEPRKYQDVELINPKEFLGFHKDKSIKILANNEALLKMYDIKSYSSNFIKSNLVLNVMSDEEIIISLNKKEKQKKHKAKKTILMDELKVGDYVVHDEYGVGKFVGISKVKILKSVRDYIEIMYQNEDKVLLPIENINLIDRYISDSGSLAVLDKLGRGSFSKIKAKTKQKLLEIANEIIKTASERKLLKSNKLKISDEELAIFQHSAGFDYTIDQISCVDDISKDLQSGIVMDRLLSADVGFGKTEVALNAMLIALKSGYQVAYIAPTRLLAHQHYKSIHERLSSFGFSVAKLDSALKSGEKKQILSGLKEGEIDICIGTHSIFSAEFNNLAFLVIDEEHKFGVKQKEKLKALKKNLHILSMSATPIPRSLNMALSSLKQYSVITTAPVNRKDIRTFVKEYNESLIKEAVLRELRRGGQIFYLHNRISTINQKKKELLRLMPTLKILVLHSEINSTTTDDEILKFENKEYDLLLCTSIIESGIHLPNVNTLIVEDANKFGMADLHQLRGRVGRSATQGFCYFLVEDKDSLNDDAKKRLLALESNSFLGSGSVLAYHDLEIRGGGNLIGKAQSGHIKNIGYSMYLKMLEECINTLLNKQEIKKKSVDMQLSVSAYISEEYIPEDRIRLELYRRLGLCENANEIYEIEQELCERFGRLDEESTNFISFMIIKVLAIQKGISKISNYNDNITIDYEDKSTKSLKAKSKDDDDVLEKILIYLKK